jgi:hypothetical protein
MNIDETVLHQKNVEPGVKIAANGSVRPAATGLTEEGVCATLYAVA